MLDVDLCIMEFTPPPSDPDPVIAPDKWLTCLIGNDPYSGDPFVLGAAPWFASWLSANDKLHSIREKRHKVSVYRTNIHDGVSIKLIDDAEGPDSGN